MLPDIVAKNRPTATTRPHIDAAYRFRSAQYLYFARVRYR